MQYLRILLSGFGEEDFQRFVINNYVKIVFGYYFTNNAGGTNFNDTLHTQGPFVCNI